MFYFCIFNTKEKYWQKLVARKPQQQTLYSIKTLATSYVFYWNSQILIAGKQEEQDVQKSTF